MLHTVAWYPTGFVGLIGIAGITTALISLIYGGRGRPYATFLVVGGVQLVLIKVLLRLCLGPQAQPYCLQVGDWGRSGEYNQSLVAEAMAAQADKLHPDFILGMGDNFYPSEFSRCRTLLHVVVTFHQTVKYLVCAPCVHLGHALLSTLFNLYRAKSISA